MNVSTSHHFRRNAAAFQLGSKLPFGFATSTNEKTNGSHHFRSNAAVFQLGSLPFTLDENLGGTGTCSSINNLSILLSPCHAAMAAAVPTAYDKPNMPATGSVSNVFTFDEVLTSTLSSSSSTSKPPQRRSSLLSDTSSPSFLSSGSHEAAIIDAACKAAARIDMAKAMAAKKTKPQPTHKRNESLLFVAPNCTTVADQVIATTATAAATTTADTNKLPLSSKSHPASTKSKYWSRTQCHASLSRRRARRPKHYHALRINDMLVQRTYCDLFVIKEESTEHTNVGSSSMEGMDMDDNTTFDGRIYVKIRLEPEDKTLPELMRDAVKDVQRQTSIAV